MHKCEQQSHHRMRCARSKDISSARDSQPKIDILFSGSGLKMSLTYSKAEYFYHYCIDAIICVIPASKFARAPDLFEWEKERRFFSFFSFFLLFAFNAISTHSTVIRHREKEMRVLCLEIGT